MKKILPDHSAGRRFLFPGVIMSISFIGGPAEPVHLALRRSPAFLRVVQAGDRSDAGDGIDALDQLDDLPESTEKLFCYKLDNYGAGPRRYHLCYRGKDRHRSGWYVSAVYRFLEKQPPQDVMRSTAKWQAWCVENFPVYFRMLARR